MLRSLFIKNYALIAEITVTFDHGLTIITGETGAGKSILLGALGLILGGRATTEMIRTDCEKAVVEAEFDLSDYPQVRKILEAKEIENAHTIIIRREINRKGTSRAFANDSPISLTALKEIGEVLVDLHGQHEHQSLLHNDRHILFLDDYANVSKELAIFIKCFDEFSSVKKSYDTLVADRDSSERERNFLEFQLQEIDAIAPRAGEDDELRSILSRLEHAEELQETAEELHTLLYGSDEAIFERLTESKILVERLRSFDETFAAPLSELTASLESIRELARMASGLGETLESEPAKLAELRSREMQLSRLKKKYGPTLPEVIALSEKLRLSLGDGGNIESQIEALRIALTELQSKTTAAALALSEARKKAAKKFEKEIVAELITLGIEQAQFFVEFHLSESPQLDEIATAVRINGKNVSVSKKGIDRVEFLLSTNKGEAPKPLVKVASGGEVSRIMLAIKTILSTSEQIPVLIFDEIDTGISGRVAQRVGTAMKRLAKNHQLLAITHLGQIAAFADHHFSVEKSTTNAATTSTLRLLSNSEHEAEIARLLAGEAITDTSIDAARSLVKEALSLAD